MAKQENDIIGLHLDQKYSDDSYLFNFDELRNRYSFLPNETSYIIDCKNAEKIALDTKFEKVTGTPTKEVDEFYPLYSHINKNQYKNVTDLLFNSVRNMGFYEGRFVEEQDWLNVIYKNRKGRVILKSSSVLLRDKNGVMRYSIGKMTDISNLGHNGSINYRYTGPNALLAKQLIQEQIDRYNPLTSREKEILIFIGKGIRNREIADRLFISEHTVKTHRKNIIQKMDTTGSINAYNKALELGLI